MPWPCQLSIMRGSGGKPAVNATQTGTWLKNLRSPKLVNHLGENTAIFPNQSNFPKLADFVVITPHPSHVSPSVMDHTGEACSINGAIPRQRNGVGARINSFSTAEVLARVWLPFIFHKSLFCLDNWQFKSKRRILSFYPTVG